MNTGIYYRQEQSNWVLYIHGASVARFGSREALLKHCSNCNHAPQWRPHWAAPAGAHIVGTPQRTKT